MKDVSLRNQNENNTKSNIMSANVTFYQNKLKTLHSESEFSNKNIYHHKHDNLRANTPIKWSDNLLFGKNIAACVLGSVNIAPLIICVIDFDHAQR